MSMPKRNLKWRPDLPDFRDYKFSANFKVSNVPPAFSVQNGCSGVKDQQSLGSCTSFAVTGAREFLEKKNSPTYTDLSPLFIYWNERKIDGDVFSDGGSSLRTGMQVLNQIGVCTELEWPYKIEQYQVQPNQQAYSDATLHLTTSYHRLNSLRDMKSCIAGGLPFVGGISVYSSFMSDEVAASGNVPMPNDTDSLEGGHALLFCAYDDSTQKITFKNSWSSGWGVAGFGTIDYSYITTLGSDFWCVVSDELDVYKIN